LRRAILLSLEMNDLPGAEEDLSELAGKSARTPPLLKAIAEIYRGHRDSAQRALHSIRDDPEAADANLKALWGLLLLAKSGGSDQEKADAVKRLGARFPKSPEYIAAAGSGKGTAVLALVPGQFFIVDTPDSSPTAAPPLDLPKAAARVSVQAGSYQMKENADDLVAVLSREGFTPTIREQRVQGKTLYKVFAGTSLEAEQARTLLEKLRSAGFSGFLVLEQ